MIYEKRPRSSLQRYFQLLRQLLKYENSGITSQMWMKLEWLAWHLRKNRRGNEWAGGGQIHIKMSRNSQTLHFNITWKQFQQRYQVPAFFTVILNHLAFVLTWKRDGGWWPPYRGCFSLGRSSLKNSKKNKKRILTYCPLSLFSSNHWEMFFEKGVH